MKWYNGKIFFSILCLYPYKSEYLKWYNGKIFLVYHVFILINRTFSNGIERMTLFMSLRQEYLHMQLLSVEGKDVVVLLVLALSVSIFNHHSKNINIAEICLWKSQSMNSWADLLYVIPNHRYFMLVLHNPGKFLRKLKIFHSKLD